MIKYKNISSYKYNKLSDKESKKPYCIEFNDGTKGWIVNGRNHREDGPAVEYNDGDKYWFLNDKEYSFEEWCNELNKTDEEKVFLRLKYL